MQTSQAFQIIAIDQIHESATNPRQTFEEAKLHELAESIRQHGLIQPITVRPDSDGFEIVAGARRFRAAQLAELFALPARVRRAHGRPSPGVGACRVIYSGQAFSLHLCGTARRCHVNDVRRCEVEGATASLP